MNAVNDATAAGSDIPADRRLSSYNFNLPGELIAQHPAAERDAARLMVLRRGREEITHAHFRDLGGFLAPGDLLVVNDTKVLAARVRGERTTSGKVEMLFLRDLGRGQWEVMLKAGGSPRQGEVIAFEDDTFTVRLLHRTEGGHWVVSVPRGTDVYAILERVGRVPLPPYILRGRDAERQPEDQARYQTVYARSPGAIAAPTAGLHFTEALMADLQARGLRVAHVTLHVGLGTFVPVREEDLARHRMHREYFEFPAATAAAIAETRAGGRRVVAVGTTSCRVLESVTLEGEQQGWTDAFIYPPYTFKHVDALITNFHLPKSTLLMLISAFLGRERVLAAYETAKREGYRFYSYGDGMLIL